MTTACRSAPNELGLLCVQLQPVATREPRDVVHAMRHADLKRTGIRRWGPAINLGIVRIQMRVQAVITNQRDEIGGVQNE